LRGTSGEDGTISWPFSAKKLRKVDLISLTPLIAIQSKISAELGRTLLDEGGLACPETVQRDHGVAAELLKLVDRAVSALTVHVTSCFLRTITTVASGEIGLFSF
jgi:hypothetical protein